MSLRDDFEKLFPVSANCHYNALVGAYTPILLDGALTQAWVQQGRWEGFQAGHAAGLEAAYQYADNYGDYDLAQAIRAMKP